MLLAPSLTLITESFFDLLIHQRVKGRLRVPWDHQLEKGDEDEKETQCRLHAVESQAPGAGRKRERT